MRMRAADCKTAKQNTKKGEWEMKKKVEECRGVRCAHEKFRAGKLRVQRKMEKKI